MPTYTVNSFTPNQTPVSEGGDFATAFGSGLNVDGSGNLNSPTGWNSSYVVPAVDEWDRASMFIEADVTFSSGVIGVGWLNDSGSAAQAAGLRFHLNGATSALLREYTDASSLEIYTSLPAPTWTGAAIKIGLLLTDSASANTMNYAVYVDRGSGLALADTNATGTITMQDAVLTMQPWLAGNNGGNITAMEARDAVSGVSVTQADDTPEDGVQQSFTTTGLSGTITAASLGGVDILPLLSDTDPTTATTYTYNISATEASTGTARINETSTLSVTATGGSPTQDVTIGPITGWGQVTLITPDKTANGLIATLEADLGITISAGDSIYWDTANNASVNNQGVYTSDLTSPGQFTELVVIQGGTPTTVATSEGAAFYPYGESGGITPVTKYRRFPWQQYRKA